MARPIAPAKLTALPPGFLPVTSSKDPTAVYDINSATLYLPNGDRLEAHSGLKQYRDNSKSANLRNRGATPPGEYILSMREKPYFGVDALRMTPACYSYTYGRGGFLAHSHLGGPRGDSHGCIAIKNYAKLLKTYRNGQVRKMMVVAQYAPAKDLTNHLSRWWPQL